MSITYFCGCSRRFTLQHPFLHAVGALGFLLGTYLFPVESHVSGSAIPMPNVLYGSCVLSLPLPWYRQGLAQGLRAASQTLSPGTFSLE